MRTFVILAMLVLLPLETARAQGAQEGGINPSQTAKVVSAITDMFEACRGIPEPYRPDCTSRAFQRGARKISNNPGYWEAHVALTRAARSLAWLVREHEDPDGDSLRVQGYRLNPVAPSLLPALRRTGADIFARAEQDLEMLPASEREAFAQISATLRTQRPWP